MMKLSRKIRDKILFPVWTLLLACMVGGGVAACSGDDLPPEPGSQTVGRTVLVYMVTRNTLGSWSYDTKDLNEMKAAAATGAFGKNRLIVFHSEYGEAPKLKEITPDGITVLKTYPENFVAVQSENMNEVIADTKALAPARNYGIVLWSHANGWLQTGIKEQTDVKTKAFGDDSGKSMNVTTLARVLDGKGFDFVYFDCCFMGGVEVAYQLRNATPRIVASVSELPSNGMPYNLTLPYLMADEANLVGAANATFCDYDALSGSSRTCTMSVIETDGLQRLASAVRDIYAHHPKLPVSSDIQAFVSTASSFYIYGGEQFFDLGHYLSVLTSDYEKWEDGEAGAQLSYAAATEALQDCVAYRNATPWLWEGEIDKVRIDHHCGLSTFLMDRQEDAAVKGYNELDWYRDVASALFEQND